MVNQVQNTALRLRPLVELNSRVIIGQLKQNFFLFTSAIDFNVVNPSNNTFNRQKIIITIFVNETKCHFEKNKKKEKKTLQN
jgi:hypothetical protein